MTMQRIALGLFAATAVAVAPAAAQQQQEWSWNGAIPAGRTLEIKGINGGIRAVAGTGTEARVRVTKRGRKNDPDDVRMVVVPHGDGVTICAVYPHQRNREPNDCVAGAGGRSNVQNNDVSVEWEIEIPRGVNFTGRTINGGVEATGITGTAIARTINGEVRVSTTGVAHASSINGSLDVTLGRSDWKDELAFETTNGSIVVSFTNDLNAQVNASTVTGDIETDFPLEVRGRFMNRRLSGTVGSGGRVLSLQTVNGSIKLQKK